MPTKLPVSPATATAKPIRHRHRHRLRPPRSLVPQATNPASKSHRIPTETARKETQIQVQAPPKNPRIPMLGPEPTLMMMMNSMASRRIEHLTAKGASGAATPTQTQTPLPTPTQAAAAAKNRRKLPRRRYPAEYLSRGSDLPQAAPATPRQEAKTHSHTRTHTAHILRRIQAQAQAQPERETASRSSSRERESAHLLLSKLSKYVLITVFRAFLSKTDSSNTFQQLKKNSKLNNSIKNQITIEKFETPSSKPFRTSQR